MVLETLAQGILDLVDWGRGIIVFLIIIEIFKGIKGNDTVSEAAGKTGKWLWERTPLTKAKAKRLTKKEMNEYIMEAKEEKNLDEVKNLAVVITADLEVMKSGRASSGAAKDVLKKIERLGKKIRGARKYFNGLNRKTTRAQTGITRLFNYMKKKGLKNAELVEKVTVFEENILKFHQQTKEEVGKIEAFYTGILNSDEMKALRSEAQNPASAMVPKDIDALIKNFKELDAPLQDAYKRQIEAKKEVVALISLTRGLM